MVFPPLCFELKLKQVLQYMLHHRHAIAIEFQVLCSYHKERRKKERKRGIHQKFWAADTPGPNRFKGNLYQLWKQNSQGIVLPFAFKSHYSQILKRKLSNQQPKQKKKLKNKKHSSTKKGSYASQEISVMHF